MLQKEKLYSVKADAQSLLLSPMIIEDHYVTAYEANMVLLSSVEEKVLAGQTYKKSYALSVRCVQDQQD